VEKIVNGRSNLCVCLQLRNFFNQIKYQSIFKNTP